MRRFTLPLLTLLYVPLLACGPQAEPDTPKTPDPEQVHQEVMATLNGDLQKIVAQRDLSPVQPPVTEPAKVELGRMLFFDSIMSGNKDVSCGTCHRPLQGTVDGVSLPAGTAAHIDPVTGARTPGSEQGYMPRNVPDLFNRGQQGITTMFWDMTLQHIVTDAREDLFVLYDRQDAYAPLSYFRIFNDAAFASRMNGLPDNLLAAQNMMPVLNRDELRGASGHTDVCGELNEMGGVADLDAERAWELMMARLLEIPGYRELFQKAYPGQPLEELSFVHAANGISAFITESYTLTDSPWDRYLAGEQDALGEQELRGALLFFGKGQCSACHTGDLFTDQDYHNIGVPPIGSGPSSRLTTDKKIDRGVAHRSLAGPQDNYKFRTPPLRNVALTAPYMHNGAYYDLAAVIRHKNDAHTALWSYDATQIRPEFQSEVHRNRSSYEKVESTLSPLLSQPLGLTEPEIQDIVAFLGALTSPQAHDLTHTMPQQVPSGLPINVPANSNLPAPDGEFPTSLDASDYCNARKASAQ